MDMSRDITIMIDSEVNITNWLFSLFLILLKSLIFLVIEFFVAYHYRIEIAIRINLRGDTAPFGVFLTYFFICVFISKYS